MEGLTRAGNDIPWITDGEVSAELFKGTGATITNHLVATRIASQAVCDWNIRMIVEGNIIYTNQCFDTKPHSTWKEYWQNEFTENSFLDLFLLYIFTLFFFLFKMNYLYITFSGSFNKR
jgi:hypothetical protein